MLTEKEIKRIKEELDNCKNPLYFFHDDADGLCSFLLLYRYKKEGHGIVVKTYPVIDEKFLKKVEEYKPDKIFILDLAVVEQEFIDKAKTTIIWIDHHEPIKREKVLYFNPRKHDIKNNFPTSYLCYQVVKQDLWVAVCGIIGDWFLPDFLDKFNEKHPGFLPEKEKIENPGFILFKTKLGELIRILSFMLKGKTQEAMKCVKILTRINDPYEIIEHETAQSQYLYKRYVKINEDYQELLKDVLKKEYGKILVYNYPSTKMSFSGDLANELMYLFPEKVIIVGRVKSGEVKCSLRSPKNIVLNKILEKALIGVDGYGGGHENACGACVKEEDFERFVENIKEQIS